MKKHLKILLVVLALPVVLVLLVATGILIELEIEALPQPFDYDDPESLVSLAERTERYIIRANPDKDSPERIAAIKALEDIALLDVSDDEKGRLIHERFPEESFWTDDMKYLLKTAESGDAEAQFQLGCYYLKETRFWDDGIDYEHGKCIIRSGALAGKWFRRAALQGHKKAQNRLFFCYSIGYHPSSKNLFMANKKTREQKLRETDEWHLKAIANKDPSALLESRSVPIREAREKEKELEEERWRNMEEGLALARKAASQGHVQAMLLLGRYDYYGSDEWFRQAAEFGSVVAMLRYADTCEWEAKKNEETENEDDGDVGEAAPDSAGNISAAKADQWRRKAFDTAVKHLDEGDADDLCTFLMNDSCREHLDDYLDEEDKAAFAARIREPLREAFVQTTGDREQIGNIYTWAAKVAGEDDETICRHCLEAGYLSELYTIAMVMLENDNADPQDRDEALRLLRVAAGFGPFDVRYMLGVRYLDGKGVPQDREKGIRLLRQAAGQRESGAMMELSGRLWHGGPWKRIESLKWYLKYRLMWEDDSPTGYCTDWLNGLWNSIRGKLGIGPE